MLIDIPCKIGDEVWGIRLYYHTKQPIKGKVSEIYFIDESMRPCIVVKGVCRGYWGEKIFATQDDAEKMLKGETQTVNKTTPKEFF